MSNMELWEKVCVSDPDSVKKMTHGAKLNAVDAHSQILRATELWGPYGLRWGLTDLQWHYIMDNKEGTPINIALDAKFFYPDDDATAVPGHPATVKFEISSDIKFAAAGECRKKLMTDVTTKALSKLGFNADVFLNKFSDSRYITKLKSEKLAEKTGTVTNIDEFKDAKTVNFESAVYDIGASAEQTNFVLGVEGFESLSEITKSDSRRSFVAALKKEVAKG